MNYTKLNEKEILKMLKETLSEKRYKHSKGTAKCARELAKKFNLNEDKAYLAGLLHDCAKCYSNEILLEIIKNNLNINENEMMNYKTLHAPVSAYLSEQNFGIYDDEILSAIRWHTLGKEDMSCFEKIIFIADKIEPNTRDKDYRKEICKILKEENGLDKALLRCYQETIKSLVKRNLKICPLTINIYNNLISLVNKNEIM